MAKFIKSVLSASVLVLFFFVFFGNFLNPGNAKALTIKDGRPVKIGVYDNPPKVYRDTNGEIKGFWADIIDYISIQEGWEVQYVYGTFDEGLKRLESNSIDIMVDVAYSPPRASIYDFTDETAFINWAGVYSRPDLNVEAFKDFEGKKIAVMENDIHFIGPLGIKSLLESFGYDATFVHEATYADCLKAVEKGDADIGIVNRLFGENNEQKYDIKKTSVVFNPIELKFAISKGTEDSEYLKTKIDQDLKILKADPDSIYYKSIIENLEGVVRTVQTTPTWITPVLLGMAFILLALLFHFFYTRRQKRILEIKVKEKAEELLKSEVKFKQLLDLLPQTIFETNLDGAITYINDFGAKIFGYSKDEFLNNFKFEKFFAPNVINTTTKQLVPDLLINQVYTQFTAQRKDLSQFEAYLYSSPIIEAGRTVGIRAVISDLTQQNSLKEKFAYSN